VWWLFLFFSVRGGGVGFPFFGGWVYCFCLLGGGGGGGGGGVGLLWIWGGGGVWLFWGGGGGGGVFFRGGGVRGGAGDFFFFVLWVGEALEGVVGFLRGW